MRRLRDRGGNMDEETAVTMSAIYDTQSRTLENLQLLQLQVEALGAPSPEKIITGDYDVVKLASGDNAETVGQLSHRVNEIFEETKKSTVQFEKLANEQDRQIRDLQDSIRRLQETLSTLDVSKKHLKNIHQD
ncbi:hypothetical protein G6F35_008725 [Rhizopus arrhizus]|nr:hypothetical protein G6F35_008725 [Rhizopus arrhizus]